MLVQRVLILLWKYLLVKEEELFYWWKMSKFLLAALFANAARRVDVSKFRVENTAILRLRPRKPIFLLFSKIKNLFARTTYIRLLIYLKAIYGQKNKGNRFFNHCHSMADISWPWLLGRFQLFRFFFFFFLFFFYYNNSFWQSLIGDLVYSGIICIFFSLNPVEIFENLLYNLSFVSEGFF